MPSDREGTKSKAYTGRLTALQAASAIQAARLNALDLLDTAEILFTLKRFGHSVAFATLAIEESAKPAILLSILFSKQGELKGLWRSFRQHQAKTWWLKSAIEGRIRTEHPEIPPEQAKVLAENGPSPAELETAKQRSLYSDCVAIQGEFSCLLPRNVDWRQRAWERLCEARTLVDSLRDYAPEELEIWKRHSRVILSTQGDMHPAMKELEKELVEAGFIKDGWWKTYLEDVKAGRLTEEEPNI